MALNEKDPELELEEIRRRFEELPEVRLPASLTAENLFARLNELEEKEKQQSSQQPQREGKVISLWRAWRPVLSYAAVFVLLVAVYYGMGIDTQKPSQLMASDQAVTAQMDQAEGAEESSENQTAATTEAAAPRVYAAQAPEEAEGSEETGATSDAGAPSNSQEDLEAPLLSAVREEEEKESETDGLLAYYGEIVQQLRQAEFWPETEIPEQPQLLGNEIVVRQGDLYFRYKNIDGQPNVVEIYQDKGLTPIASFQVADAVIIDLVPMGERLAVIEEEPDAVRLYTGQLLAPLESADAAALPECGAVTVSVYDISNLEQPVLLESFTQDGRYLNHMTTEEGLVIATRKHIDLEEEKAALLCHAAPVVCRQGDETAQALVPEQVTAYPDETWREYVVLSLVDLSGEDRPVETQAVLGSRLSVQLSPTAIFVLDSEAKENGGHPQAVVSLGELEIQLR